MTSQRAVLALTAFLASGASAQYQTEEGQVGIHTTEAGAIQGAPIAKPAAPAAAAAKPAERSPSAGRTTSPEPSNRAAQAAMTQAQAALSTLTWDPGAGRIPPGARCAVTPPKLSKMGVVIHSHPGPDKYILDSTPKVCDRDFCDKVGFTGRSCCPLGLEGSPERVSCEFFVLGIDPTDGIPGPHWMFSGPGRIQKHPDNPFLAIVHGAGTAAACSNRAPAVCSSIPVP